MPGLPSDEPADLDLGYDPRPALTEWQGTPLPPVYRPLSITPRRAAIAAMVWWQTPPWGILRNRHVYLWHVLDFATKEDLIYTVQETRKSDLREALLAATPGRISAGAWWYWSIKLGLRNPGDACDWPSLAHRLDVRHRSPVPQSEMLDYLDRHPSRQRRD